MGPFADEQGSLADKQALCENVRLFWEYVGSFADTKTFLFEQTIVAKVFGLSITGRVVQKLCCVCGSCVRRMCV